MGFCPGIKDENNNWSLKGHKDRIVKIDRENKKVIMDLPEGLIEMYL